MLRQLWLGTRRGQRGSARVAARGLLRWIIARFGAALHAWPVVARML
jgi:hypothetical protein